MNTAANNTAANNETDAPNDAPIQASKFVTTQAGKLVKSKTRFYLALVLDVIHNHGGIYPRGYPASVALVCPTLDTVIAKYCTIIKPAISGTHALHLATFAPTEQGLDQATEWLTNQSKLGGYSMSLEDSVRFFKGAWSVQQEKAQKDADQQARQAAAITAVAAAAAERTANGAHAATLKDATTALVNAAHKEEQSILSTLHAPSVFPPLKDVEPAVATLGGDQHTTLLYVTEKADGVVLLGGLDTLSLETICALADTITAQRDAMLKAADLELLAA